MQSMMNNMLPVLDDAHGFPEDCHPQLICCGAEQRPLPRLTLFVINAEPIGARKYISGVRLTIAAMRTVLHSTI